MSKWYRIFIDEPRQLPWYLKFLDYRFLVTLLFIAGVMWAGNWIFNPKTVTAAPEVPQTVVVVATTTTTVPTTTTSAQTTTTTETPTTTTTTATTTTVVYKDGEPGSCLILEERYCSSGVVVHTENGFPEVAFNLPTGTPIFAPYGGVGFEGQSLKAGYYGVDVLGDNQVADFSFVGADDPPDIGDEQIELGSIVGYLAGGLLETPSTLITDDGSYNLLVAFAKDGEADTAMYQELFGLTVETVTTTTSLPVTTTTTEPVVYKDGEPGSCLILEERYCSSGVLLVKGGFVAIGFNLPPETPVFAGVDGKVIRTVTRFDDDPTKFPDISVKMGDGTPVNLLLYYDGGKEFTPYSVSAREVVGRLTGQTLPSPSLLIPNGEYNFVVFALRDTMQLFFPGMVK